jgi:hypothetical protein
MKLELKHLSPYLPYNLKGIYHESIITLSLNGFSSPTEIGYDISLFLKCEIKPILRPLYDLQNKDLDLWIDFGIEIDEANTHYLIDSLVKGTFYAKDIHFAFRVREALFKMHFDVFRLIENGLAININTLKS